MANTATRSIVTIERTFDAPRALVWQAFTDPERVKQWWGPETYDCLDAKVDLRAGGNYRFAERAPDGHTQWSGGAYRDVVPMERIVGTYGVVDEAGNHIPGTARDVPGDLPGQTLLTVTFEDASGGKTKVSIRHEGLPADIVEEATAGWNSSLDKLAALLRDPRT
jgi:uncharacterized protein YndB with AHSA1/START domain